MLARKLGQVVGFHFTVDEFSETTSDQKKVFNPQLLIDLLKESGMEASVIEEVEQAVEKSKLVKDEAGLRDFFRRDVSQIQDNRGAGTIYAVDVDNAPEMNLVEKVFRSRDMLLEKGQLPIILPEEELKKHQKDPKMNSNDPRGGGKDPRPPFIPTGLDIPSKKVPTDEPYPLLRQPEQRIVVPHDSLNQRYCICAKKNDNQQYVQCEDECEWYHPECVGFPQDLFDIKQVKFLCPFCKTDTRRKIQQLEQQGTYRKIKSRTEKMYFAYVPEGYWNKS